MGLGFWELAILLVVVLLFFGDMSFSIFKMF